MVSCIRKKERKMYYHSIKLNKVTYIKAFWETVNPFLSNTGTNVNKFSPVDDKKSISDDEYLCRTEQLFPKGGEDSRC